MCRGKKTIYIIRFFNNARMLVYRFRSPTLNSKSAFFCSFFFFSHSQIKHSSIKVPYKHRVAGTRKTGNTAFDLVLNESVSHVVFAGMKRTVKRNQKLICKLRNAECYN